jgi:hypothetical protein
MDAMELWPYRSQLHAGIRRPPFIVQRHCGRHMLESLDPIASFSAERSVATTQLGYTPRIRMHTRDAAVLQKMFMRGSANSHHHGRGALEGLLPQQEPATWS